MASEETLPGSALNQAPLEQPADPQHTDSTVPSATSKPFKQHNSSSPSPSPATAQVPLQVHVPAGLAAHPHAATRTLPGGLLAQSPYAPQLPAGQAGLMPFPYGQQLIAAAAPRGLGMPMQAGLPGLAAQPMMLPGGGLIRHPRRTLAPVSHPYQRVSALQGAATQPVQPYQMLAAGRAAVAPQQTVIQTPYGQMLVPVSSAGLQYRLPAVPQPPPPQPAAVAMDPTMAALYGQYQSSYPSAYLPQFQQPTMAALAAASAQYGAAAQFGAQPQYLSAAASREQQQQQLAAAYAARAGAGEQPQYYDPQKLLNAHYAQLLMPEQTNNSPAANGTTTEYSDQET